MKRIVVPLALAFVVLVLVTHGAHAQTANTIDQIVDTFRQKTQGWQNGLQALALRTFGLLALIELSWAGLQLVFRRADLDEWVGALVQEIMFLGLFLWLLQTEATWGPLLIEGFTYAAQQVGGVPMHPGDVFASGLKLASEIIGQMSIVNPGASVALFIGGLAVMACFAVIVVVMVVVLVESYFMISAGMLLMAFGGSRWTKDFTISLARHILGLGAKLFAVQLIAAIGTALVQQWVAQFNDVNATQVLIIFGCAGVLAGLTILIPNRLEGLISGSSVNHSGALFGLGAGAGAAAVGAVAAVGGVGVGAVGAGAMFGQAGKLAGAQMAAQAISGTAPRTAAGRVASMAANTVKNAASAPLTDIGRRLSGEGTRQGSATWRMASDLGNRRRLIDDEQTRPRPPSPPSGT